MKLLIEKAEDVQYLTEAAADGKQNMYVEGIFMVMNTKNRNGRIYEEKNMVPSVMSYIKERVEGRNAWGELGHPSNPTINQDRISHRIVSLEQDGNNWIGKAIITETPCGLIAKGMINSGGRLGVSSRGLGSLKTVNGVTVVQEDFKLCTAADIVDEPSAPGAWVKSVMENTNWYFDELSGNWKAQELVENTVKAINKLTLTQIQEYREQAFNRFLANLSKNYNYTK